MRIVVFGGAGHIGSGVVRELVKLAPDAEVIIADKNFEKAKELSNELGGRTFARSVDANDFSGLVGMMKGADVALSTIGPYYVYGTKLLNAAIDAKTNFVDIDDDHDATKNCLDLHEKAKKAGIVAIIGLGASPGLLNLMAKQGAEKLDKVDEIHTAWAWTGVDPDIGPAIVAHYFHAITGEIPTYRDGEWVKIKALSEPEIVEFPPPIGEIEVYHVGHPEPVTIPRYIKGVKVVTNKGTIWPKLLADISKFFVDIGLTSLKELNIGEASVPLRDILVALTLNLTEISPPEMMETAMKQIENLGEHIMGVGLKAEVEGESRGQTVRYSYGVACRSAILATALPAALGALMIARGKIKEKGVFAPEGVIEPKEFLKEIAKEIEIFETEERIGKL